MNNSNQSIFKHRQWFGIRVNCLFKIQFYFYFYLYKN